MENKEVHEGLEALYAVSHAALALARLDNPQGDWSTLNILMDLEDVLDKGRIYGSRQTTPEEAERYKQTVANMDQLRGIIRDLLDAQDTAEALEFMKARGASAMNQFRIAE